MAGLIIFVVGLTIVIISSHNYWFQPNQIEQNGEQSSFVNYQIPELLGPQVKVNDIKAVEEKLKRLNRGGKDKLQVITDFDRTITKYHTNGKLTLSSYGIFALIPEVPNSYKEAAWNLYKKYGAIEEDPAMPIPEKIPYMEEWWEKYEKIIVDVPFDCDSLNDAVTQTNISIRDGVDRAFRVLNESQVPVLVFSAGLGDVVASVVRHNHLYFNNVKVISNFFSHKDGHINGFKNKPIHVFNKNEHAIENTDYFNDLSGRPNVILLGDSLGDSFMADGVPGDANVLKIGFLNSQVDASLASYLKHFDLVLIDDQTMDVLNAILKYVLS